MADRIFLMVSVLIWIPYGLYCLYDPAFLEGAAGLAATNDTGTTELRAMYGGLQVAIGLLALFALLNAKRVHSALWCLAILIGGIGIARLLGALVAGDTSGYTLGAVSFEFVAAAWATWLLARDPSPAPAG